MLGIEIAEQLIAVESLDNEINQRHELINNMVGTLYPNILRDEIYRIIQQREKIERILKINYDYYGKKHNLNEKHPDRN
jgi:hypothetical protein